MSEEIEYLGFAEKLLEKTAESKVPWQPTYEPRTFIAVVEGFSFQIGETRWGGLSLTVKDEGEAELFTLSATIPDTETSVANDKVYGVLAAMFERARRIALNIDRRVAAASNLLDKL